MCQQQLYPKGLVPVEAASTVTERLANLRETLEAGASGLLEDEVPAVLLLADVCDALGLSDSQREVVLGKQACRYLTEWGHTPIRTLTTRADPTRHAHFRHGQA